MVALEMLSTTDTKASNLKDKNHHQTTYYPHNNRKAVSIWLLN